MLSDNKNKLVELFLDNIIWGNVTINQKELNRHLDKKTNDEITDLIEQWVRSHESDQNFPITSVEMTNTLYLFFMAHRFTGGIVGELKDRDGEKEIQTLRNENDIMKAEIKELIAKHIKAEGENKKLHDENITLANELEDLKNIVNSYESKV